MRYITMADVVADPTGVVIPTSVLDRFHLADELIKKVNRETIGAVLKYITRPGFSREYELMVVHQAVKRDPTLLETSAFIDWAKKTNLLGL